METVNEIKAEKEKKVSELIKECKMFFAFSNEQFETSKTALKEGEKYVSFGAGAFLPKSGVEIWEKGIKIINTWYKETIKKTKNDDALILYEINNHEAYYTGSLEDVYELFEGVYSPKRILNVYKKNRKNFIDLYA